MKYFGTVKSFDSVKGFGEIKQEAGGDDLRFEKSAISWDRNVAPTEGQRLSYQRRISMQSISIALAGAAALSLATPASGQWGQDRTYSHQLQLQIDLGVNHGTISRRESIGLRESLRRLVRLERRFSPNGISGRE